MIQRLRERQVALQSQIADLSTTLLPGHPRIRALEGQLGNLDAQILQEAERVLVSLQTAARVAAAREESLQESLNSAMVEASRSNEQEIELRALEREATAQRDLLESFLGRYREAVARTDADYLPADARIISQAVAPREPSYPKKAMMSVITAIAVFLVALTILLMREFMSGRAFRIIGYSSPSGQAYPFGPREEDAVPVAIAVTAVPAGELRPSLAAREAPARRYVPPPPPPSEPDWEDEEDEAPRATRVAIRPRPEAWERPRENVIPARLAGAEAVSFDRSEEPEMAATDVEQEPPAHDEPDSWHVEEDHAASTVASSAAVPIDDDDWRPGEPLDADTDLRLGPEVDTPPWPEPDLRTDDVADRESETIDVGPTVDTADADAAATEATPAAEDAAVEAEETSPAPATMDEQPEPLRASERAESAVFPEPMAADADPELPLTAEAESEPTVAAGGDAEVPPAGAAPGASEPTAEAPVAAAKPERLPPAPYAPPERDPPGTAALATIVAGGAVRVALFAGAQGGEGAGEIAYATARNVVREKQRCVVVDIGAQRSPALAGPGEPGLSELLAGEFSFGEVIRRDEDSRVHVIPMGRADKIPAFQRLQLVVGALTHTYDKVIVVADTLADWPDQHMHPDLAAIVCGPGTTEIMRTELYESALERGARSAVIVRFSSDGDGVEASEAA